MTKMIAGQALVKVLEAWGVDHIYGIPGGSINHTVEGLYLEKADIDYIQVRHEEVGALAASADAKFTGKIGVSFGSAALAQRTYSTGCMMPRWITFLYWHLSGRSHKRR